MKLKARYHEEMVYLANSPFQYLFTRGTRFFGKSIWIPGVSYFVNDPFIAKEALKDTEHFSSSHTGSVGELISDLMGKESQALLNMQGDAHHKFKFELLAIFQPEFIEPMVSQALDEEVADITKQLKQGKEVDMSAFIKRCTARMTCQMLGITAKDKQYLATLPKIAELSDKITSYISIATYKLSEEEWATARSYYEEFTDIVKKYYDKPTANKMSVMAQLKVRGFSFDDSKALLAVLMIAGTETVSASLPRIIAMLIDDEQWEYLSANKELLNSAIDEGLRLTSPSPMVLHSVTQDFTIDGCKFKKDRRMLIVLVNILKNPRYFPRPFTYDINREQDPKLRSFWFAAGPHFCLGSELAKKLRTIIGSLLEIKGKPVITSRTYGRGSSFPGYKTLKLKYERD
jgi:cytochrome P450